MTSSKGSQN